MAHGAALAAVSSGIDRYPGTRNGELVGCPTYIETETGTSKTTQNYVERPIITSSAQVLLRAQETAAKLAWNHGTAPPLESTFLGTFSAGSTPGTAFTLSTRVQLMQGVKCGNLVQILSSAGAPLFTTLDGPHTVRLPLL